VCPAFGVSLKLACRTRNVHRLGFGLLLTFRIWISCPLCGNGWSGLAKACVHSLGYSLALPNPWRESKKQWTCSLQFGFRCDTASVASYLHY
jgi:hypothetical protein